MKKIKIVLMILLFAILVIGMFSNTSLIVKITFAILIATILKTTIFYLITKLRYSKKQQIKAEDIIKHKYNVNNSIPKIQKPIQRDEVIEKKYTEVKSIFTSKMKNKQMNRDEILALRNYLTLYLHEYEVRKFKNDAHAIYSMLKSKDMTLDHLNEIEDFLNSVE